MSAQRRLGGRNPGFGAPISPTIAALDSARLNERLATSNRLKGRAPSRLRRTGGIPVTTLTSGGAITKIRLEHIWVEAAIDYVTSRGAQNRDADTWVALDPSFKQYEYLPGLDVAAIGGIDPEQLAQSFLSSGTVNETEGWATGFDPAPLQAAQTQAQQALQTYISQNLPNATVGDVIGGRKTILRESPILPSGLPYPKAIRGAHYDKIPASLQQQVKYAFGKDVLGDLIDPLTLPWSRVNNQKLTLSFKPATEADEQTLLALLPQGSRRMKRPLHSK